MLRLTFLKSQKLPELIEIERTRGLIKKGCIGKEFVLSSVFYGKFHDYEYLIRKNIEFKLTTFFRFTTLLQG